MRPLHSREDLINVLRGRCRTTAMNRSLDHGTVIVLGGFKPSSGIETDYWVVEVRSKFRWVWWLAVFPDICPRDSYINVREIPGVDWKAWAGVDGVPSIYNGDEPTKMFHRHLQAFDEETEDGL